jgi:hypothetical protein
MVDQITVTPTQQQDGSIAWSLCYQSCGGPAKGPKSAYPDIMVPADGMPHEFKVTIGQPDLGISFAPDALWVTPGKGKHPSAPGLNSHHQINSFTVDTNGKTLSFTDENSTLFPHWLSYRLNFVQGTKPVAPIDPDWHNGGGGFSLYFGTAELATVTLVSAIVLLLIGFGLGRFMSARKVGRGEIRD